MIGVEKKSTKQKKKVAKTKTKKPPQKKQPVLGVNSN